jgi:glyceraldehyde 3-phosphate dehydrogenase
MQDITEILNNKEFTNKYLEFTNITIEAFPKITNAIEKLDIAPTQYRFIYFSTAMVKEKNNFDGYDAFVKNKFKRYIGKDKRVIEPIDVVLFGFGRIGRLAARELIQQHGKGEQLRLRAIVTRGNSDEEIKKRSSLLRKDSVHGKFRGVITEDYQNKTLIANGNVIHMIAADNPATIDYTQYGINNALLIDNSGIWRDEEKLSNAFECKRYRQSTC